MYIFISTLVYYWQRDDNKFFNLYSVRVLGYIKNSFLLCILSVTKKLLTFRDVEFLTGGPLFQKFFDIPNTFEKKKLNK